MTSARNTAVQKLEANFLQQMLGRRTRKHVNKMRGAIAAVYTEAKTSHDSFPLRSKFGFSAAIQKKDKYIALHNNIVNRSCRHRQPRDHMVVHSPKSAGHLRRHGPRRPSRSIPSQEGGTAC